MLDSTPANNRVPVKERGRHEYRETEWENRNTLVRRRGIRCTYNA